MQKERPSIKSPQYTAMRGAKLTDARIEYYIRQGRYGAAAQRALHAREHKPKRQPSTKAALLKLLPKLD